MSLPARPLPISNLTARQLTAWGAARLQEAEIANAALDARLLLEHMLGISREKMLAENPDIPDSQVTLYDALILRRSKHEPLARILGKRDFWKDSFRVTPAVLDPRADSETVIEAVLEHYPEQQQPCSILDLGTGSGCLLLSLLREYPYAQGTGVDQSPEALAVAQENALQSGLAARSCFIKSDWLETVEGAFDIIVSNPPYIASYQCETLMPEVRDHDPHMALDGGIDGLDAYRRICATAATSLAQNGILVLEAGAGQAESVIAIGKAYGWALHGIRHDLAGIVRVVILHQSQKLNHNTDKTR